MSSSPPPDADATQAWRDWLSQSEAQWNSFFNQLMATDEFSQSAGRSLDLFLHFQKTMNEAMGAWFTALNVPTRNDVLELGDRLLEIEGRLAAIEAALVRRTSSNAEPSPSSPPRTKRPPVPPVS